MFEEAAAGASAWGGDMKAENRILKLASIALAVSGCMSVIAGENETGFQQLNLAALAGIWAEIGSKDG